jgi:hypothetical protein
MNEIISRKDAKASGEKYYFTGKPCKHGHISLRYTDNLTCKECIRVKALARVKKNPEHVRVISRRSQKKCSPKHRIRNRLKSYNWSKKNPDKVRAITKRRYEKNAISLREKSREWYKNNKLKAKSRHKKWYSENSDLAKSISKNWRQKNTETVLAYNRNRRSICVSNGGTHTGDDVLNILKSQHGRCAYCRKNCENRYHVDHIMPISKGGSNWPRNLQILCVSCNLEKCALDPIEYSQSKGLLV